MNLFSVVRAADQGRRREASSARQASRRQATRLQRISAEPPRDPTHGDVATNAAMVLAKPLGRKAARAGAADRRAARGRSRCRYRSQVAGPGFVNLRLTDAFWAAQLAAILQAGTTYGHSKSAAATKVNVEYVSANPTGPMHVGHCRGAVVGDALANLLAATGHAVTREYYINDAGAQVDALARSAYLRYREALGEDDRRRSRAASIQATT